jgi:hypothetical protein
LEYSPCGNKNAPFCNCNNQNATCVQPYAEETVEITDTITGEQQATADGLRRLLAGTSDGGADALDNIGSTSVTLQQYCLEDVTVPSSSCPPGQMPIVTYLALEQVHLLIFTIAVVHVFLGFLLYLAASARLWLQWSRWNDRDDPHTIIVRDKLEEYYTSLNKSSTNLTILRTTNTYRDGTNGTDHTEMTTIRGGENGTSTLGDDVSTTSTSTITAAASLPRSTSTASTLNRPLGKTRRSSSSKLSSVAAAVMEAAGIDLEAGRQDPRITSSRAASFKQTAAESSGEGVPDPDPAAAAADSFVLPSLKDVAKKNKSVRFSLMRSNLSSLTSSSSTPLPDVLVQEKKNTTPNRKGCCGDSSGDLHGGSKNIFIKIWEYSTCFLFGVSPIGVVDHETYSIMRASYIYTHKLSTQFAFLDHVQRNLEDDLSHIVGLSAEFWIIIVLFILSSGPFGYAVTPFMSAVAFVLCITNAKLVDITRKVTRKGGIGRLTSSIFWFNRPQLLLIPIKLVLFFCAFIYASFIFFAWQFGDGSCPFKDGFYTGWVLPWYTILIVNTLIFFHMAIVTLPTYSLCVLMGSDVKAHMLPRKFAKKLLAVAAAAKEKVKAEKAAAAKAAGVSGSTTRGGILSSLTRLSQAINDTSEISKGKEENNQPGVTTSTTTPAGSAAATGLETRPLSPSAAPSSQANLVDLAPAQNAMIGDVKRESRFDKAVSLISRRLVGVKPHDPSDRHGQ